MAHIPMGDVKTLWDEAPHSWSGLAQYARSNLGKKNRIADYLMIELPAVSQKLGSQSFPNSPQQLYDTLNQQMKDMPHHTTQARDEYESRDS